MTERLQQLIDGVSNFFGNMESNILDTLEEWSGEIVLAVRDNLLEGIGGSGEPLEPSYADDTYFESREKMEAYIRWKTIHVENARPVPANGAPNLWINGMFHESLMAVRNGDSLEIVSDPSVASHGEDVIEKYGKIVFAPTDEWYENELRQAVKDKLIQSLRKELNI